MKYCPKCGTGLVPVEMENKRRLKCPLPSCDYVFWDNPVPVVAAIVETERGVILVRNKSWPPKMYGLVTGFLEKGETPEAAVLREVKEELNLDGTIACFVGHYSFFQMNQLILAFHVEAQGEIELNEELAEYRVVDPSRLRPWSMGTGLAVKDWLEKYRGRPLRVDRTDEG